MFVIWLRIILKITEEMILELKSIIQELKKQKLNEQTLSLQYLRSMEEEKSMVHKQLADAKFDLKNSVGLARVNDFKIREL